MNSIIINIYINKKVKNCTFSTTIKQIYIIVKQEISTSKNKLDENFPDINIRSVINPITKNTHENIHKLQKSARLKQNSEKIRTFPRKTRELIILEIFAHKNGIISRTDNKKRNLLAPEISI